MSRIEVVLVDDHPLVREGVKDLLNADAGIAVVGEACSGAEALALCREMKPDVVVLDIQLPDMTGIEVLDQLELEELPTRVLVFSAHDDLEYIQGMMQKGICGYLLKDEMIGEVVEAVRGVGRGEKGWLSRRIAARMSVSMRKKEDTVKLLTGREREVLAELVQGLTNKEIAARLGISEKTVEKHLESIFRSLEIGSRVEAAVWAARKDLAPSETPGTAPAV